MEFFKRFPRKRGTLGGGVGYNDITDVLARRTFDESGHYYIKHLI